MRVIVQETSSQTSITPCSNSSYYYGETEDYTIADLAVALNTGKVSYTDAAVDARIALTVAGAGPAYDTLLEIQTLMEADDTQATAMLAAIALNTAKVGVTAQLVSDVDTNTLKVGITPEQAAEIVVNNAKVGYTEALVSANTDVAANTAKISFDSTSSTKLGTIEEGAEVNVLFAPLNTNSGTAITLALTDANDMVICTAATAVTLTVPPNSSVAFTIGTEIILTQYGAGVVTIAEGAGVTINSLDGNLEMAGRYGSGGSGKGLEPI